MLSKVPGSIVLVQFVFDEKLKPIVVAQFVLSGMLELVVVAIFVLEQRKQF